MNTLYSRRKTLRWLATAAGTCLLMPIGSRAETTSVNPGPEAQERHCIYLLLTCSLVAAQWRIRKSDPREREAYADRYPGRHFNEYLGHNIGALIIGPEDKILTFQMNEANYEKSSLAHAEAKAVEEANNVLNRMRFREGQGSNGYADLFAGAVLYTTLESCSQCTGIMHLAGLQQVVYAQDDKLQKEIGKSVFEAYKGSALPAPMPVKGDFFPLYLRLQSAFGKFQQHAEDTQRSRGTTAFLSSTYAYEVFQAAHQELADINIKFAQNLWHKDRSLKFYEAYTEGLVQ